MDLGANERADELEEEDDLLVFKLKRDDECGFVIIAMEERMGQHKQIERGSV